MRISEDVRLLKAEFPDFLVLVQLEEMLVAFGPDAIWLTNLISFIHLHHLEDGMPFAGFPSRLSDIMLTELTRKGVDCLILSTKPHDGGVTE